MHFNTQNLHTVVPFHVADHTLSYIPIVLLLTSRCLAYSSRVGGLHRYSTSGGWCSAAGEEGGCTGTQPVEAGAVRHGRGGGGGVHRYSNSGGWRRAVGGGGGRVHRYSTSGGSVVQQGGGGGVCTGTLPVEADIVQQGGWGVHRYSTSRG